MSKLSITVDGFTFEVEVDLRPASNGSASGGQQIVTVMVDGVPVKLVAPDLLAAPGEMEWFIVDDRPYEVMIDPNLEWIRSAWGIHSLEIEDLEITTPRPATGDGRIKAPIPGVVSQVLAAAGERVERGQPLLVLEAMKMQNELRAPRDGRVKAVNVAPGQRVALGEVVAEVE